MRREAVALAKPFERLRISRALVPEPEILSHEHCLGLQSSHHDLRYEFVRREPRYFMIEWQHQDPLRSRRAQPPQTFFQPADHLRYPVRRHKHRRMRMKREHRRASAQVRCITLRERKQRLVSHMYAVEIPDR